MNVLLVNAYSARNRGDGMIVSQMIALFRARGCEVRVISDDPGDRDRLDAHWVAPLVPTWGEGRGTLARVRRIARILRAWAAPPAAHESFRWADLVVSAGGGYLYDDGGASSRMNIMMRLLPLRTGLRAGLPVVLFSQSIGPFRARPWALLVASVLRRCRLVIVRERYSLGTCEALGISRLELCDDVAFVLEPGDQTPERIAAPAIGVTVLNSLPGVGDDGYRAYRAALRDGLLGALRGRDEAVAVVSQVAVHGRDSDLAAARELASDLVAGGIDARFVDLGNAPDRAAVAFYEQLDLVVASRLHSGILALCAGTPVIGLSYLPKTDGVLERAGFPDLVLPAGRLEPDMLAATLRGALERRDELRADLARRLPALRAGAARAADLALEAARS